MTSCFVGGSGPMRCSSCFHRMRGNVGSGATVGAANVAWKSRLQRRVARDSFELYQ